MTHALSLRSLVQSLTRSFRTGRRPTTKHRRFTPRTELLEDLTLPSSVFWNNPAGGNWMTPANWRDDMGASRLPGAADDVFINQTGITVTHSAGTDTVRSLTSRAAFVMSGGTLTAGTSVYHSTLNFFGGTMRGGDQTIHGLFSW